MHGLSASQAPGNPSPVAWRSHTPRPRGHAGVASRSLPRACEVGPFLAPHGAFPSWSPPVVFGPRRVPDTRFRPLEQRGNALPSALPQCPAAPRAPRTMRHANMSLLVALVAALAAAPAAQAATAIVVGAGVSGLKASARRCADARSPAPACRRRPPPARRSGQSGQAAGGLAGPRGAASRPGPAPAAPPHRPPATWQPRASPSPCLRRATASAAAPGRSRTRPATRSRWARSGSTAPTTRCRESASARAAPLSVCARPAPAPSAAGRLLTRAGAVPCSYPPPPARSPRPRAGPRCHRRWTGATSRLPAPAQRPRSPTPRG
jgi:hypothetical protein